MRWLGSIAMAFVIGVVGGALASPATATPFASRHVPRRGNDAAPNIIIDTDLSRWWDDATALGLANVLEQQGDVNVLGIVSDIRNPVAVAALDAIDTAYGHGRIPLGAVAGSDADTAPHGYSDVLAQRLPHTVQSSADVPDAVSLYRKLLKHQPDQSVTIVSLGAYTNLASLLDSPARERARSGRALVARKVKRLVIMDGLFPFEGLPAFTNQKLDLPAASVVVNGWPGPIAWVDGLDGISTLVGGTLCATVAPNNPMRIVYETLFSCGPPGDGDWDAPALLFAIGDIPDAFTIQGRGGAAAINATGGLSWQANSLRPDDYYVHLADQSQLNARIDDLLPRGFPPPPCVRQARKSCG